MGEARALEERSGLLTPLLPSCLENHNVVHHEFTAGALLSGGDSGTSPFQGRAVAMLLPRLLSLREAKKEETQFCV